VIANLMFDIPAEEKAFMRAARADEVYEALVDIQMMASTSHIHPQPWDDSDVVSNIRLRLKRLKNDIGDLA